MSTLLAFVSTEPPASVIPAVQAAKTIALADFDARLRWVRPEGVHLTLKFLGNVEVVSVPGNSEGNAGGGRTDAADGAAYVRGWCAPNPGRARAVWLKVGGETAILDRLQADRGRRHVQDRVREREERRFHPHLTLARVQEDTVGAAAFRINGGCPARALYGEPFITVQQ